MLAGEPLRIGPDRARALCVFLHGRGQSPQDFAMLAEGLAGLGVATVLPGATGGSWYEAKAVDALTDRTQAQLAVAMDAVGALIDDLRVRAPGLPLVLAGFSQGACVALELAFRGQSRPDSLVAFTGCRVGQAGDARPLSPLQGMPVVLTGADADPWITVSAFAEAVADLGRAGARLRAELYPGRPHEVSLDEAAILADLLGDLGHRRTLSERAAS
ncbi:MAG: alpha/beta hydrolase [Gemmobacter sp.]